MKNLYTSYFQEYLNLGFNESVHSTLESFKSIALDVKSADAKLIFCGNGASAAISAHAAVDFTKQAKVRGTTFNEADLITCYSNDYGYENWISKTIDHFLNSKDLVIFLSVSGNSKNLLNAAKTCIKKKINIVALTGLSKKNKLNKIVKNNFWVNSKSYNQVEMIHFIILGLVVDKIVGKAVYGTNL